MPTDLEMSDLLHLQVVGVHEVAVQLAELNVKLTEVLANITTATQVLAEQLREEKARDKAA